MLSHVADKHLFIPNLMPRQCLFIKFYVRIPRLIKPLELFNQYRLILRWALVFIIGEYSILCVELLQWLRDVMLSHF